MRSLSLLIVLFAVALPSKAQWRQDGRPVADDGWRRSDGPFGAMLVLTDRPKQFLDSWALTSTDFAPTIHRVSEATRGAVVAAMILFTSCQGDSSGKCQVEVDFKVLGPDGGVYAEHREVGIWDSAQPPPDLVQLGKSHLMLRIEPGDPLGSYQLYAVARDRIAGRQVSLKQSLSVVEAPRD
jgi:hypothetical protein